MLIIRTMNRIEAAIAKIIEGTADLKVESLIEIRKATLLDPNHPDQVIYQAMGKAHLAAVDTIVEALGLMNNKVEIALKPNLTAKPQP